LLPNKSSDERKHKKRHKILLVISRYGTILLVMTILLLNLFTYIFPIVRYNGDSMMPNLQDGQILMLLKTQDVQAGDMIAFYYNNQVLVRRIICEGGKQITIENDGSVYVDMQKLEETYLEKPSLGQCNISFPFYVRNGCVFAMGDNREIAMDSRLKEIGLIPIDRIIGKVILAI